MVPTEAEDCLKFEHWPKQPFHYDNKKNYFDLIVPTKDTVRFSWLVKECLLNKYPLFFTGVTGVGKSTIINSAIQELSQGGTEVGMSESSSHDSIGVSVLNILIVFKRILYSYIFLTSLSLPKQKQIRFSCS